METVKTSGNTSIARISSQTYDSSAILLTSLRWVSGWIFFSAFWRRLILADKLDPDSIGYVGEKFNHFLPNAIIVKPMIHYLVTHPDFLYIFLIIFTVLEALVGLGLLLGFLTRVSALGVFLLSAGILFGAGWLGTTCLDEWQIGVFGVVAGLILMISGSERPSLDQVLLNRVQGLKEKQWFKLIASGNLNFLNQKRFYLLSLSVAIFSFFLTLTTNQVFHGGVWGNLHNLSVRPHIEISDVSLLKKSIKFSLYRDEGADVYGAFVTKITLKDQQGKVISKWDSGDLASLPQNKILNSYIAKVKPGKSSLIVPLGAKADIQLQVESSIENGSYILEVEDISGLIWNKTFNI